MQSSSQPYTLDVTVSTENYQEDVRTILQHIRPGWDMFNIRFKIFTDGLTNKLIGCYVAGDIDSMILVRINGDGSEIVVNRDAEQEAFRMLTAANYAPPLLCTFNNGLAYGFFPGLPLDEKSVRLPVVQRLIAEELVRFHNVSRRLEGTDKPQRKSQFRERLQHWLNICPTHFDDPVKQQIFETEIPSRNELQTELSEIADHLDSIGMNIVLCHNDLLLKNIVYNKEKNTVRFIDYEYAFYNYEAYDIGDHFAEYAGMDEVNYDLYPSKDEQLSWLRHYLHCKAKSEGRKSSDVTDKDVEKLYVETNKCACASHFFWGVWGLLQAAFCSIDFDYLQYAKKRLAEYYRRKKEFFALTV